MNLYSNKQKWKIALLLVAIVLVGLSLFVSNNIVSKVSDREKQKATQWADAIKKKLELVQLTTSIFKQLREKERQEMNVWVSATKELSKPSPLDQIPDFSFPLSIIEQNKDIPVILLEGEKNVSGSVNLDFDTSYFRKINPNYTKKELNHLFEDSLIALAKVWRLKNEPFTVEVYEGLFMTYVYDDSKEIAQLEREKDSILNDFNQELINNTDMVPVVLVEDASQKIIGSNLPAVQLDSVHLKTTLNQLKKENKPIQINFNDGKSYSLYFDDSPELKRLVYFPYIQFIIIGLFIIIGYIIFSTFRKAEQNQVWAGMAKETAHQLGTPISSLMAWVELLKAKDYDTMVTQEMEKDIYRLTKVTERFSKIGSGAKLEPGNLYLTVKGVIDYLKSRISDKIEIHITGETEIECAHNAPLMEWVIENITKNAIDAMENTGTLTITLSQAPEWAHIDIKDTGKGLLPNQFKSIFKPGFTTKKRGWGLGLSLVRRIVKDYHKGKVFVKESVINEGTTFRISIPL